MKAAAEQEEQEGEEETRLFRLRVECRMLEVKNMIKQRYRCLKETPEILTTAHGRDKGAGQALKMTDCPYGKAGSSCGLIIGEESREEENESNTSHLCSNNRGPGVERTTKGLSFERAIGLDEYWHLKVHYKTTQSRRGCEGLGFLK
jgi:hypothetical protein